MSRLIVEGEDTSEANLVHSVGSKDVQPLQFNLSKHNLTDSPNQILHNEGILLYAHILKHIIFERGK